jgi:hypothetical protein
MKPVSKSGHLFLDDKVNHPNHQIVVLLDGRRKNLMVHLALTKGD